MRYKILVLMSDNRPLDLNKQTALYNSLAASINYSYCLKYGHDFIYFRPFNKNKSAIDLNICVDPSTKTPRHAAWAKLMAVRMAMEYGCDYVTYIDSDCIFRNFSIAINDIIEKNSDKLFMFQNNAPWGLDKPCSGFFICKVCDKAKNVLRDWYNFDFAGVKNPCRWEQGALWLNFKKWNEGSVIGLIDGRSFEESEGQFIRHLHSKNPADGLRMCYLNSFMNDNNISLDELMSVKQVPFDTETFVWD